MTTVGADEAPGSASPTLLDKDSSQWAGTLTGHPASKNDKDPQPFPMVCRYAVVLVLGLVPAWAHAEILRCAGGSVIEGDSRLSLLYKCGAPDAADAYCAPVYIEGGGFIPAPWTLLAVPCQVEEQLLYDRGPGQLLATVYVRNGVVQSITYGRAPR